jgi:hypothetical protein
MLDVTKITRLPLDVKALQEGYLAGRFGPRPTANPYPVGTPEALAWQVGRKGGRAHLARDTASRSSQIRI